MKQLVRVLYQEIDKHIERNKSNIIRLEGFDNPIIYQLLCTELINANFVDYFVPKITSEKYYAFCDAKKTEWEHALAYLHRGNNSTYSDVVNQIYADNSFIDFNNAITKIRNAAAEYSNDNSVSTALFLLMGTESAPDTGGLADTSFVISPKELIETISKDYSIWFSDIITKNCIYEDYKKAIHTLYKGIFSQIPTDIFVLSDFIDSLEGICFSSVQDLITHICETLNTTWGIPSVIDKQYVPKVDRLNKGQSTSTRIISNAVRFINRSDDIPSSAALKKLHKKFDIYAENHHIITDNSFPEDLPVYSNYWAFENSVIEYMRGINIDINRGMLLKVDFSIIHSIIGTRLPAVIKEKTPTFSGIPVEAFSRIFFDVFRSFYASYSQYPTKVFLRLDKVTLSDCTEDTKEDFFQNICSFVGGILNFFNENTIDIDGEILEFQYDEIGCDDPFVFENYNLVEERIKCSGKWGDPNRIQFSVIARNEEITKKATYKWAFSSYSPWVNAFGYMTDIFYEKNASTYIVPTILVCENMQDYLDCESEDEFYSHLQQLKAKSLFDDHRRVINQYFPNPFKGLFDLVCNDFKEFALSLTQKGFFNAGNKVRAFVQSYTRLQQAIYDNYHSFTDVQKEKLSLLLNLFSVSSNTGIISNGDMGSVIIPAYSPIMLEKIDAQQLFLRRGFKEILTSMMEGETKDNVLKAKFENLIQMASITQAADIIRQKSDKYLTCKNMWEYFGVYYGEHNGDDLLATDVEALSIVIDDEDVAIMLKKSPMSNVIVRNVMDYLKTFPARADGLNIVFIAPVDMQHIVSAIHSVAKQLETLNYSATINIKLICINSKKNSATYLRKWLDSYFDDERIVRVNTFLHHSTVNNRSDVDSFKELLDNYDLCFTYNVLQPTGVQFDLSSAETIDKDYEKFPMTFTPDTLPRSHGKMRRVNISHFQFLAARSHTQASYLAGHPHSKIGMYRVFRTMEILEIEKAIIDIAHRCCKWVVCIDQAIDRYLLEGNERKIIGFTTGEGSYGELNVTVSARADVLSDIKKMLRKRLTEKFTNWDADRLKKAADFCIGNLSKRMDGSRVLKALNPYDYEIHNFLAYVLSLQMLGVDKKDDSYIVKSLISLDSYKHWFKEDDIVKSDNSRPDFMLIEIPYTDHNLSPEQDLDIHVKIIECKMGFQNQDYIGTAKTQLEKGLESMAVNWNPDSKDAMHRYWLNQLYRVISFSQVNMDDSCPEYPIVKEKIYNILNGQYHIKWTGDIFAFWLDINTDTVEEYEIDSMLISDMMEQGIEIENLVCHNCGQMFIQKMLLPEEERSSRFAYNHLAFDEQPEREEEEEPEENDEDSDIPVNVDGDGSTLPRNSDINIPFLKYLADGEDHSRKDSLIWFKDYFKISEADCQIKFESNNHPKWETIFDTTITSFRKNNLLTNTSTGLFHLTEFGKRVFAKLEKTDALVDFFKLVKDMELEDTKNNIGGNQDKGTDEEKPLKGNNNINDNGLRSTGNEEGENDEPVKEKEHQRLEDIRVLIGNDRRGIPAYWEFGHPKLANRHILITGTSGQGKTYAIQTMLYELANQGISSVVFDYTDGFLPGKLEPEFEEALGNKITQKVALISKIPVNPFRLQSIEIPPFGSVSEKSTNVAGRISDILKHVYSFGDQQSASIYAACKLGVDQFGSDMNFAKLRGLLEEAGTPQSKSVLSKMAQFFDMELFDTSKEFDWREVTQSKGNVTIIQLTGLDRELQTVVTEIMMWDAWYSLTKFGNKETPFVVVLDEAQNLSFKEKSPAEKILREGRKYGWSAWFATQFLKGALDSGEISNLQQAAERLYFKPTDEEVAYVADQISDSKAEIAGWFNILKGIQKGQCIVQGNRIRPNGKFGAVKPTVVEVSSFNDRK